jgi:hypothetical protein
MEDLIKALQIFLKYSNDKTPTHCGRDYLYVNVNPDVVSDEDKAELYKLGFLIDQEYGGEGFGSFRFGSY